MIRGGTTSTGQRLVSYEKGKIDVIVLQNPKPLHALTLDMIDSLKDFLVGYTERNSTSGKRAILFKSSQENIKVRAFCAGGDVKQVALARGVVGSKEEGYLYGQGIPGNLTADFFRHEYMVNHMLATSFNGSSTLPPQVSLWDGVVMGGGVGISIHGQYRVATEHTLFAMPETKIGLFPDVGSMFWMPRLLSSGGAAVYLALTGARLGPTECISTGLATHYVSSSKLDDLEDALAHSDASVPSILDSFHEDINLDNCLLKKQREEIDKSFDILGDSTKGVEDIILSLKDSDSEFADKCVKTMSQMSPTSMKITLEGLRRGSKVHTIGEDLQMEYRISQAFMREKESDFYEGVRAALIDKDGAPKWNPPVLEEVTQDLVETYFSPIHYEWSPFSQSKL